MNKTTKLHLSLAALAVGLGALLYFASSSTEPTQDPAVAAPATPATSAAAPPGSIPQAASPTEVAQPAPAAEPASSTMDDDDIEAARRDDEAGTNKLGDLSKRYSADDLKLPAMLGEKLGKPPPPAVYQLLDMKKRDADADDLVEHVQREFPKDLKLRALTIDWLEARRKAAKAPAAKGQPLRKMRPIVASDKDPDAARPRRTEP